MRFFCVRQPAKAHIYGHEYSLKPLDPRIENIQDILVTDLTSGAELLEKHPDFLMEVALDTKRCNRFPVMVNEVADVRPGGKVLILKNGGIGDHIAFLPALRVFRELFPASTEIWLAAQQEKHPLYLRNGDIRRLLPLPITLDRMMESDYLIDFSTRQDWYDLHSMNTTDCFLNFLKVEYKTIRDKSPRLMWGMEDSPQINERFRRIREGNPGKPLVLLNWRASNRLRDMPPEKLLFLAGRVEGVIFIAAQPKGTSAEVSSILGRFAENVVDCSSQMSTLAEYIGAVANCDAIVSTDTGTVHLAEGLGKPCLALYGPTIDDLWIRYYRQVRPLRADYSGRTCRSPCGMIKNMDRGCPEAVYKGTPYSPCLLSIAGEKIESAFMEMMAGIQDAGSGMQNP
jgi:ADP-heptose:LPS heptosyltransferase